jgi:hypothetical protein
MKIGKKVSFLIGSLRGFAVLLLVLLILVLIFEKVYYG